MIGFQVEQTEVVFTKIVRTVQTGSVPRFRISGEVSINVNGEAFTERFSGFMGLIEESRIPDPMHLKLSPLYLAVWKNVLTARFLELSKTCLGPLDEV